MRAQAVAGIAAVVALAGCGGSAAGSAQVVSGSCEATGAAGRPVSQPCQFILSNGREFRCPGQLTGRPTAAAIHRAGCVALPRLRLSPAQRAVGERLDQARGCLGSRGIKAIGGPALPAGSESPDGELVVRSAIAALYTSASKAQRLEPAVRANAQRFHGEVDRRGAVTIVWIRAPGKDLRAAVEACVFRSAG